MAQTLVLAVGTDLLLLETRSQVLRSAGYTVVPARSVVEAVAAFLAGDFDLVMLCHSVPVPERLRLVTLLRTQSASIPIVQVQTADCQLAGYADASLDSDPLKLLLELKAFLAQSGEGPTRRAYKAIR